ncbi:hypothetical protein PGT21_020919 [Puccinia graminis f. sp. tritici]|uniref:Uncharacterized protein n=1 Tax=Puccinia graminis f. sp. tritici TaxID=56615 RepID=A0A5B0NL83_PUCGR|nr:hypothetical protein PGT21_020919 [Puccinia graminis f. sp. tritici]
MNPLSSLILVGTFFQLALAAPLLLVELTKFWPYGRSIALLSASGWSGQFVGDLRKANGAIPIMREKSASAPSIGGVARLRGDSGIQIPKCDQFPHVTPTSPNAKSSSTARQLMDPLSAL